MSYESSSGSLKVEVTRIKVYSNTAHPILRYRSTYTQTPLNLYSNTAGCIHDVRCDTGSAVVQPLFGKGSVPLQNRSNYTRTPLGRVKAIVKLKDVKKGFIPK